MDLSWEEDVKEWLEGVDSSLKTIQIEIRTLRARVSWLKNMTRDEPKPEEPEEPEDEPGPKREFALAGVGSSKEKSLRRQMRDAAIHLSEAYLYYWNEGTDKQVKDLDKARQAYDEISKRWSYGQQ